ncbi:hypothetical protein [Dactylosporangium sp. NPDC006015]|uniref:hypothetical protein n=1 Tax=Dactylosporangium sp. NPDC006015 TaxID=3154576 RepID=UPI0033B29785
MKLVASEPMPLDRAGKVDIVCWIRVYRAATAAVVIVTEVPGNPGNSVTNVIERIAAAVISTYLPSAPQHIRWFLCYPGGVFGTEPTEYSEVVITSTGEVRWLKGGRDIPRSRIEQAIGASLDLLPPHEEVLDRVLAVGGQLQEQPPTVRFVVVPVSDLPPPRNPFQCVHHERFWTFMREHRYDHDREAPREVREHFYTTLTPNDYAACRYHTADWRRIVDEAVRIVDNLGDQPDEGTIEREINGKSRPEGEKWGLWSLLGSEGLTWSGDDFTNGQHRGCAIRASGAARIVKVVAGPPTGPPNTWRITDDA